QNGVLLAISAPTCSTYSCQLFSISSLNSCGSVPSRSPCWRFSGWYTTRSDTSARARRRAFCFGSCTRNGFTGRSGLVMRCPGAAPAGAAGAAGARGAAGAGDAAAGVAGRAGGAGAARGAGAGAAGARAGGAGDAGGRSVGVGGAAAGAAGGAAGRGGGGAAGGTAGAATGPEKRGIPGGRGGTGTEGGAGGGAGGRGGAAGIPRGGVAGESEGAAGPAGAAGARWPAATAGAAAPTPGLTGNTLLHTAQRARTPPGGTLAGSTRYTVSHDGQVTFTLRSDQRAPGSSSSGSCRRSTTNTDPGCVLA